LFSVLSTGLFALFQGVVKWTDFQSLFLQLELLDIWEDDGECDGMMGG